MKTELDKKIDELESRIASFKREVASLRSQRQQESVKNYEFLDDQGNPTTLLDQFGDSDRLVLVHNMGIACSWCSMWADGFSGLTPHMENHGAFVVVSPDPVEIQNSVAKSRGWKFRLLSSTDPFIDDMGFMDATDGYMPGVSVFARTDNEISRVGRAEFDAGDDYCAVWSFLNLFPEGAKNWEPLAWYPEFGEPAECCASQMVDLK